MKDLDEVIYWTFIPNTYALIAQKHNFKEISALADNDNQTLN